MCAASANLTSLLSRDVPKGRQSIFQVLEHRAVIGLQCTRGGATSPHIPALLPRPLYFPAILPRAQNCAIEELSECKRRQGAEKFTGFSVQLCPTRASARHSPLPAAPSLYLCLNRHLCCLPGLPTSAPYSHSVAELFTALLQHPRPVQQLLQQHCRCLGLCHQLCRVAGGQAVQVAHLGAHRTLSLVP